MKKLYCINGKVNGIRISPYAVQYKKLDYSTLSQLVGDMILNNHIFSHYDIDSWELVNGIDCYAYDKNWDEVEPYSDEEYSREYIDIYQVYIIDERGAEFLKTYTNEIVYYNSELDLYIWGITHFGTSWSYVLTDVNIEWRE